MIAKNKERISITLEDKVVDILDVLAKTGNKTRSQVVKDGIALLFTVAIGSAKIEVNAQDEKEEKAQC